MFYDGIKTIVINVYYNLFGISLFLMREMKMLLKFVKRVHDN